VRGLGGARVGEEWGGGRNAEQSAQLNERRDTWS
jgi:hypothetical protein